MSFVGYDPNQTFGGTVYCGCSFSIRLGPRRVSFTCPSFSFSSNIYNKNRVIYILSMAHSNIDNAHYYAVFFFFFVNLIIQIIIELNPVENKMILKGYNIDSACASTSLITFARVLGLGETLATRKVVNTTSYFWRKTLKPCT
jgi:hypothetical protein